MTGILSDHTFAAKHDTLRAAKLIAHYNHPHQLALGAADIVSPHVRLRRPLLLGTFVPSLSTPVPQSVVDCEGIEPSRLSLQSLAPHQRTTRILFPVLLLIRTLPEAVLVVKTQFQENEKPLKLRQKSEGLLRKEALQTNPRGLPRGNQRRATCSWLHHSTRILRLSS